MRCFRGITRPLFQTNTTTILQKSAAWSAKTDNGMSSLQEIVLDLSDENSQKDQDDHRYGSRLECILSALAQEDIVDMLGQDDISVIKELEMILQGNEPETALLPEDWVAALQFLSARILPQLSPLELHASVLQSIFWSEDTNDDDDDDGKKKNAPSLYRTLCLVLLAHSLRQCPSPLASRRRRWRSVFWESLRMFQRYGTVSVWIFSMFSALSHVQSALKEENEETLEFSAAFFAATVSTCTQLACRLSVAKEKQPSTETNDHWQETLDLLLDGLERHSLPIEDAAVGPLLCLHPWRQKVPPDRVLQLRRSDATFEALLAYYTASDDRFDDQVQLEDRQEAICFVETDWDLVGLALIVTRMWYRRPVGVLSMQYQWRLWFPHVSFLLNAQIAHEDGKDEESPAKPLPRCQKTGFELLQNLLLSMPKQSLEPPRGNHLDQPLSPTGTLQLLSNRIIASNNTKPTADGLPTAGQTFQVMKDLVSKYTPMAQVNIVQTLLHSCPHFGLKPKLLDLWRPFVNSSWPRDAQQAILDYLDKSILQTLETDHLTNNTLNDVPTLVSTVEVYGAALGLIQLWLRQTKELPTIPCLKERLLLLQNALQAIFQRWNESVVEPPQQGFRLYLFQDAVEQTLQLIGEL